VTTRSTGRTEVSGSEHCPYDFRLPLRRVLHGDDDALRAGHEVHRAAHARDHLARDHPVGETARGVDLQGAEAPSCRGARRGSGRTTSRCRTCRRRAARWTGFPPASVSSGWCMPSAGGAPVPDQAVLRLEENAHATRHEVRDERRDADAEIDQHASRSSCAMRLAMMVWGSMRVTRANDVVDDRARASRRDQVQ
jgi:hypothetical protein